MAYLKAKNLTAYSRKLNKNWEKNNHKLICLGKKVYFKSEKTLEDYVEADFNQIFPNLNLIKRQHRLKMQRCDLLCCTKTENQPVIIELKNEADRGLVAQLTRYRQALLEERPFTKQINYNLPIKLIAIAPDFHQDNYTDKEASKFENQFYFWQFSLEKNHSKVNFIICNKSFDIPYPIFDASKISTKDKLPHTEIPVFAANFRGHLEQESQDGFTILRTLFMAQPKIKEMVSPSYRKILYGTGDAKNSKKLAEITNTGKGVCLFLWLPTAVKTKIKIPVARFGIVLNEESNPLSQDSIVKWLVYTKTTIEMKNEPEDNALLTFNRQGMTKWTRANMYLAQASVSRTNTNTFDLLMYLIKGVTPPFDEETLQWWKSNQTKTPVNLGWYINLAIKTWNYRLLN